MPKKTIKQHISVINDELGQLNVKLEHVTTDICWIKKSLRKLENRFWYLIIGLLFAVISSLFAVIM